MRQLPNTFLLSTVRWDVFCTLTFKVELRSLDRAVECGLVWLEVLRMRMRLHVNDFYWFLRPERGELGGRVHLHALLRVRPVDRGLFVVPQGLCMAHRLWGRGMTRFRFVEGNFDAVAWYLQKESTYGADLYEDTKSAGCRDGVASCALLARALLQESGSPPDGDQVCPENTLERVPLAYAPC